MKVLVAHGLDLRVHDDHLRITPLESSVLLSVQHGVVDFRALHAFYLDNDGYDEDGLSIYPDQPVYFYEAISYFSPLGFCTLMPSLFADLYKMNIEERVKYFRFDDPEVHAGILPAFMRLDGVLRQEDILELYQKGAYLLSLAAFRYGPIVHRGNLSTAQSWRRLLRDIIPMIQNLSLRGFDADPKFQSQYFQKKGCDTSPVCQFLKQQPPMTPLFTALSYFRFELYLPQDPIRTRDLRRMIHTTLTWWLEDLAECKVDLLKYGRRERALFLRNQELRRIWYRGCSMLHNKEHPTYELEDMLRLADFTYGPRPADWKFHWDMEIERFVGDFWDLVENPIPHLPGSWL